MRYRVVGWISMDDSGYEEADSSEAAEQAIIADIREHGWEFSGMEHIMGRGCVPVLNDGKARTYTDRCFGAIMAIAKGDLSPDAYIDYAFIWDFDLLMSNDAPPLPGDVCPFNPDGFVPETDLNETFYLSVGDDIIDDAEEGRIVVAEAEVLAMIDKGDTLVLTSSTRKQSYLVHKVERGWIADESKRACVKRIPGALPHEAIRKEVARYSDATYAICIDVEKIT